MNNDQPRNPEEILTSRPVADTPSEQPLAGDSESTHAAPPTDRSASPASPASSETTASTGADRAGRLRIRRLISKRRSRRTIAIVLLCSVVGVSVGLATTSSATPPTTSATAGQPASGAAASSSGSGSNARSGPASGGAAGTISSVSISKFTMMTSAGQDVSVDDSASTVYKKGTSSTSASSVTKGESVLVLGTTGNTTIAATEVIVQPTSTGSGSSSAAKVVPFQRGEPTASTQVGQIPANWSEGSGTIVSGTAANEATEAALAAYPGGIVDRVVLLSNGEYNVHSIGVNWPHHVFLNQDFQVVGAE